MDGPIEHVPSSIYEFARRMDAACGRPVDLYNLKSVSIEQLIRKNQTPDRWYATRSVRHSGVSSG